LQDDGDTRFQNELRLHVCGKPRLHAHTMTTHPSLAHDGKHALAGSANAKAD
jgi:hypothetical protein